MAQPLELQWSNGLFSTKTSFTTLGISHITSDDQGNIYMAGWFQGSVDLDPGAGEEIISSGKEGFAGGESFLVKYDEEGKYVFGFALNAIISDVALSDQNEVYVVGTFDTIVDFNPSTAVNNLNGIQDEVFVARYKANGEYMDGYSTGTGSHVSVGAAKLDSKNNLCIYGSFDDTVEFDHLSVSTTDNNGALFLAKYSNFGSLQFVFDIESRTSNVSHDLTFDQDDNIFITGSFLARSAGVTLDLDPGPGNTNLKGFGGIDGFWAVYSPEGAYKEGYLYDGSVHNIALDAKGNIYISGSTVDSMDIDLGQSEHLIYTEPGGFDLYLAKYDSDLKLQYGMSVDGNSLNARMQNLLVDDKENVYVSGHFRDTLDLIKGKEGGRLISTGLRDVYIAKFDKDGELRFAHSFGSGSNDQSAHMSLDDKGNLWFAGQFSDSINLDVEETQSSILNPGDGGSVFVGMYTDGDAVGLSDLKEYTTNMYTENGNLVIEFLGTPIDGQVNVFQLDGQKVYEGSHVFNNEIRIRLSHLPKEQVLVVLASDGGKWTARKLYIR
ncbi:MAG: hypothetical protein JJ975_03320 [Bacteroidia bacterium]|nr:hypothetical protein [Bacteroidia bacterium]